MKRILSLVVALIMIFSLMIMPVQAQGIREQYIVHEGVNIYTEVYNYSPIAKEAIIFLHGLGGSHADAGFLYNPSNEHMTISFDFLNHGKSGSVESINWDIHLDTIKSVMDNYGLQNVFLVGHSFGADTAMMFAKKYPNRVKRIALIDRAYYNFSDIEQFNMTRSLMELMEYNPYSGLTYQEFLDYLDMIYDTDIKQTWDINRRTVLFKSDASFYGALSMPQIIAMIKMFPEMFGLSPEQAAVLPDMTDQDITNFMNFLDQEGAVFKNANVRFDVVQTPYSHRMIMEPGMDIIRQQVLNYFKNYKINEII